MARRRPLTPEQLREIEEAARRPLTVDRGEPGRGMPTDPKPAAPAPGAPERPREDRR